MEDNTVLRQYISLDSPQKTTITDLFSDPTLQLVKLNEQEYVAGQNAYRSNNTEQEMLLEATIQAIEKKMSSQKSCTILSIGCGHGLFEKPFIKQLLSRKKTIHFVGEDPNQKACAKTQEWCQELSSSQPANFSYEIHPVEFESFQSQQNFDIILSIHSVYYFSEIESSVQKIYELLEEGGIAILGIAVKRQLLNEPYYHVCQRLHENFSWFSEDLQKFLTEVNLPFHQERIEFSVEITECFKKESELGKQILNFMIGANTAYLSPLQLQLLLDYFGTNSQHKEGEEIMLPHLTDLLFIEK